MKNLPRILTLITTVLLALVYFFPIWEITLFAPQYPEGLFMSIWINRMGNDVELINVLNHYIGMKMIHAEQIPELKILPIVFGFLIAGSLAIAFLDKLKVYRFWTIFLWIFAIACLVDFYWWGYDYGHNLSDDAPIKVPGMTYQPPLFGMKEILNITAFSYPGWGGISFALVLLLSALAAYGTALIEWLKSKKALSKGSSTLKIFSLLLCLNFTACENKPDAFVLNQESCEHCKMALSSAQFGAALILKTGKKFKFDAVDCLFDYVHKNSADFKDKIEKAYVVHFNSTTQTHFIAAQQATFVKSSQIQAPMGIGLAAFSNTHEAQDFLDKSKKSGEILTWTQVKAIFPATTLE